MEWMCIGNTVPKSKDPIRIPRQDMSIYDINQAIADLIDEETGEIKEVDYDLFDRLIGERESKIENLALLYKNLTYFADSIKAEKQALEKRQAEVKKKAEAVKDLLEYALQGEKFESPRAVVSYRKSTATEVEPEFVDWAKENRPDLLNYAEPKPALTEIKKAIASEDVPFVRLVTKRNMTIK